MAAYVREALAGGITFAALLAGSLALAAGAETAALRALTVLAGLSASLACATFAALMAHLSRARRPRYEPILGDASAWGLIEYEERTRWP